MTDGSDTSAAARPKLFQPLTIRGLTLRNRLVVPPMVHYRCGPGHTCGTFHVVHLGRYALGGFGLVFVEATGVEAVGLINENDLGIWNEAQAEIFRPLIDFMRRENTAIGVQLAHGVLDDAAVVEAVRRRAIRRLRSSACAPLLRAWRSFRFRRLLASNA